MRNSNIWEQRYRHQLWGLNTDPKLMQYFDLVNLGNVLDLGIGEGRNSLPYTLSGFYIDGVDSSETAINRCKDNFNSKNLSANLTISDIRNFTIEENKYTLIIAAHILNFFQKTEINELINRIKLATREGGIIYISAFSTLEPTYKFMKETKQQIEENTFYDGQSRYTHFFTQDELLHWFSDFEIICCCEGLEYDNEQSNPHYHGIVEFMVRKK